MHGDAFVTGSKREDGTYHRNVGEYFARQGFLTLITNYRLAPDPSHSLRGIGGARLARTALRKRQ